MYQQYHQYPGGSSPDAIRYWLSAEILFGRIVPLVLSLAVGNIYFAYMAYKLAKKKVVTM